MTRGLVHTKLIYKRHVTEERSRDMVGHETRAAPAWQTTAALDETLGRSNRDATATQPCATTATEDSSRSVGLWHCCAMRLPRAATRLRHGCDMMQLQGDCGEAARVDDKARLFAAAVKLQRDAWCGPVVVQLWLMHVLEAVDGRNAKHSASALSGLREVLIGAALLGQHSTRSVVLAAGCGEA